MKRLWTLIAIALLTGCASEEPAAEDAAMDADAARAQLEVRPAPITFEERAGGEATLDVVIANVGEGPAERVDVYLTGSPDFAPEEGAGTQDGEGVWHVTVPRDPLEAGDEYGFKLVYAPPSLGSDEGELVVAYFDGQEDLELRTEIATEAVSAGLLPATPGRHDLTLTHDGDERVLHLVVPSGFDASTPAPLMLVCHGSGGSARGFADGHAELLQEAKSRGWVLIFPQGLPNDAGKRAWVWSDPPILGEYPDPPDDVGFLLALVDAAVADLGVDEGRVYMAGYSKGGRMAYHAAALHPERFAATAVVSSSIGSTFLDEPTVYYSATPTGPMPILIAHGRQDGTLPYEGSDDVTPVSEATTRWVAANTCPEIPPSVTNPNPGVEITRWGDCAGGSEVQLVDVQDMGHVWPERSDNVGWSASARVFAFLEAFSR